MSNALCAVRTLTPTKPEAGLGRPSVLGIPAAAAASPGRNSIILPIPYSHSRPCPLIFATARSGLNDAHESGVSVLYGRRWRVCAIAWRRDLGFSIEFVLCLPFGMPVWVVVLGVPGPCLPRWLTSTKYARLQGSQRDCGVCAAGESSMPMVSTCSKCPAGKSSAEGSAQCPSCPNGKDSEPGEPAIERAELILPHLQAQRSALLALAPRQSRRQLRPAELSLTEISLIA